MIASTSLPLIDPSLTVNDVLQRWPAAVGALNALGIDTCCGGADSLSVAAAQAGVPLADLIDAIVAQVVTTRLDAR
jgi:regulator of cell morphogenesis and NO signaling